MMKKTTFICILSLGILCHSYAQETALRTTVETNVSVDKDGMSYTDARKIDIITKELGLPEYMIGALLADFNLEVPEGMDGAAFGSELQDIVSICLDRLNKSGKDPIGKVVYLYMENFSEEELKKLVKFYNTETGKKAREVNMLIAVELAEAKKELEELRKELYEERYGNKKGKGKKKQKKTTSKTRQ